MFATAGDVVVEVGAVCAAIGAFIVAVGLVTRAKPIRWFFRTVFHDPITAWHRTQTLYVVEGALAPIHEQLKPNGGHSLRDRVDLVERLVRLTHDDTEVNRLRNEAQDAAALDHAIPVDPGAADRAAEATAEVPE